TLVRVIGSESHQNKLRTVRQLEVGSVVSRCTRPTGLRPQAHSLNSGERNSGEAMALIVIVLARPGIIALQKFHHLRAASRRDSLAGYDLRQQARGSVSGQFVSV